ncbi:Transmembrane protein [Trema orientale]|uniref:Transmembrane protein n=1 Tax=Trema orientale TaxID=63057 RepID=A0A2P5FW24_TREOI|nr:Transmembrane protein [Trema orientale]
MGISASKRVKSSLSNSPEFDSACDSTFSHCLSLTQHAFPGVFPHQLSAASDHLYRTVTADRPHPIVLKWVSSPPTRSQVDSALRVVTRRRPNEASGSDDQTLGPAQFREWAVELFASAIVSSASKAVICRVPIGVAGIAGVGVVTRSGKDLVGTAIGLYALGVATAVYLSLS